MRALAQTAETMQRQLGQTRTLLAMVTAQRKELQRENADLQAQLDEHAERSLQAHSDAAGTGAGAGAGAGAVAASRARAAAAGSEGPRSPPVAGTDRGASPGSAGSSLHDSAADLRAMRAGLDE